MDDNRVSHMKRIIAATLATAGLLAALPATAQGVYRIVGPDGRVTFSDQPPPAANARPQAGTGSSGPATGGTQLPFELRQTASRYPVVLYTSENCAPCNSGRNLLGSRGIPYAEKTITTSEDAEALRRLSGDASLPFLTIGGQKLRGYQETEWTQYLDAAGYPKQSALPPGYRQPAPAPLVAIKPVPGAPSATGGAPAANAPGTAAPPAEVPVQPPVDNPAGIRF
jgi:glutaredoxin